MGNIHFVNTNLLNERVILLYKECFVEESGEMKTVSKKIKSVWANVKPIRKNSFRYINLIGNLGKNMSESLYKIVIRNTPTVNRFLCENSLSDLSEDDSEKSKENPEETNSSETTDSNFPPTYIYEKVNALIWRDKELDLLYPFDVSDSKGIFLESLCILRGE